MRSRLLALALLLLSLPAWGFGSEYFPPPESKGGWRTLLPEKGPPDAAQKARIQEVAGVNWDLLLKAWEHNLGAEGPSMLLVIRRGYVVGEWYNAEWMEKWGRNKAPGFYSTTKAYISTAFGLLLDESEKESLPGGRKLTLDTKVCNKEWMPEALPLPDARRADITLRHLLFATSGIPREGLKIPEEVLAKAKGPFEMALGHVEGSPWAKLTGEPGTMFNYSSPGVLHLVLLFNNAAKMDLLPYIKERLCDRIGMENVGWGKTGGKGFIGPYCSPGGFNCSGRDHARFLYLAMHRGQWDGKQIVPASYYDWAFQGSKANPAYGAQWWLAPRYNDVPADFVQTYGHLYNDGYVIPSADLVFVRLGRGEKFPPAFQSGLVKKVLSAVAGPFAPQENKGRAGVVIGELKARTEAKNGRSFTLEILAPGEEKPRPYLLAYNLKDPSAKSKYDELRALIIAAKIGDRVECGWVNAPQGTEGGFFVTRFRILTKPDKDSK